MGNDEDDDRRDQQDDRNRRGRARTGEAAGGDGAQHRRKGLEALVINERHAGDIPEGLECEDHQGQPGGLDRRHDHRIEHPVFGGAVDAAGLKNRFGDSGFHKLHHQEDAEGVCQRRQQQRPVGIDHPHAGDDDVLGDAGDLRAEQQRPDNKGGDERLAGEFMLGERKGSHRSEDHVHEGTGPGDKQAVEYVAGQRHPEGLAQLVYLHVVVKGGVLDEKTRRIGEDFVERLDGLNKRVDNRQRHEGADNQQEQGDGDGPAHRAGKPDAASASFHLVQTHGLLHHASPPPCQVSLRRAFLIRTQDISIIANSTTAMADA